MFRAEFCGMMTRKKEETDMKVLMLNGSCNERGCTYTALEEIGRTLREEGVDCEIFQLGADPVRDCIGCGGCAGGS